MIPVRFFFFLNGWNSYKVNCTGTTVSTQTTLSSTAISTIGNRLTDQVVPKIEGVVQETVMKAMAEMSLAYFPKIVPNHTTDLLETSQIVIPPSRLRELQTFLNNPSAQFSCHEQVVLLELMMRRTQSVLAILGTGSGKTLIVLMQAKLQKNLVSIVILPLSSLHDDFKRRADTLGVSCSRWKPRGKFNADVNVITVSIEHLGFPEFVK